jgi:predicted esterase
MTFLSGTRRLPRLLFVCILLSFTSTSHAQVDDAYSAVRADWHLCGIAEYRGNWSLAVDTYRKVIDESAVLPLTIREWFRGTSAYGIARCSARLHDAATARAGLMYAAEHHFWNFELIRADSILRTVVGPQLIDSLAQLWAGVEQTERMNWKTQSPIVYTPHGYDNTPRWPLLIAMHGGNANYESFAFRWKSLADSIGAVIVVPPGIIRESEITNSWGGDFDAIAADILPIVKDLVSRRLVDSNQVYLTGFSQGGQATVELSLRYPHVFKGGVAMSGFTSTDFSDSLLEVAHSAGTRLFAITGEFEDPTFRAEIGNIAQRAQEAQIPFILSIAPGMIHEVPLDLIPRFTHAWKWLRTANME